MFDLTFLTKLIKITIGIALLGLANVSVAEKIKLTSYFIPGLVESPSQGLMVDMLRSMEQNNDLTFDLSLLPTARVQLSFEAGKISSYFPELEEHRPTKSCRSDRFMQKAIIAINRKDQIPITRIEQLEGIAVGAVTGYSYGLNIIGNERIDLVRVDNDIANIRKLLAGRIDAVIGDVHSTIAAIKELEVSEQLNFDTSQPIDLLDVFFVFQLSPQGEKHCKKVSEAIEKLRINGDLKTWFGYQ